MRKYIVLHRREEYKPVIVYIDSITHFESWDNETTVGTSGGAVLYVVESIGDIILKIKKRRIQYNGQ